MENEPCIQLSKRIRAKKAPGPDGVEAWCVATGAFFINLIMAGMARMSGLLFVAYIQIFQCDRKEAALPTSVRSSIRNILGPLVGILGQKYGVRPITIIGGIIVTLSSALCFFVNDILWVTILWGGLNGIGSALTTTLPQVTIGQHFKKHRSTASGITFSGGCIGAFLFPVILDFLLHTYHLGGTFLIIAGITMHVIPAAMILKAPSWLKKPPHIVISEVNDNVINGEKPGEFKSQNSETEKYKNNADLIRVNESGLCNNKRLPSINANHHCSDSSKQVLLNDIKLDTNVLWENRKLVIRLLTDDFTVQCPASDLNRYKSLSDNNSLRELGALFSRMVCDVQVNMILQKDLVSTTLLAVNGKFEEKMKKGSYMNGNSKSYMTDYEAITANPLSYLAFYLENLFERDRDIIIQSYSEGEHEHISKVLEELRNLRTVLNSGKSNIYLCSNSTTSLFLNDDSINIDSNVERPNTFCSHIQTALKLHKNPLFILISLCRTVHFLTLMPVVMTIVDFSMDLGIPEDDGKYVIAALSFGDLMGRLCSGWITDKGYISLPRYMLIFMIIQGASTVTLAFMKTEASLMVAIAIFGLFQGSIFVRHPVLVARYLGSHEQSIAMGGINFFSGILAFALPNYIGFFRDTMGSYNGMFFANGAVGAFVGLLWAFEPYCLKLQRSAHDNRIEQAQV